MTDLTIQNAGLAPGAENSHQADNVSDCADITVDNQPIKRDLDLASWVALGANVKPSRFNRKQKRGWQRGCS